MCTVTPTLSYGWEWQVQLTQKPGPHVCKAKAPATNNVSMLALPVHNPQNPQLGRSCHFGLAAEHLSSLPRPHNHVAQVMELKTWLGGRGGAYLTFRRPHTSHPHLNPVTLKSSDPGVKALRTQEAEWNILVRT